MKKLLTILIAIVGLSVIASAQNFSKIGIRPLNYHPKGQVSAQSLDVNVTSTSLNVLYLKDGLNNSYTALAVPMYQVVGLGNRVNICALGAFDSRISTNNVYVGTGISVNLIKQDNWSIDAYGGWKGFNIADRFSTTSGSGGYVGGIGLKIPIK